MGIIDNCFNDRYIYSIVFIFLDTQYRHQRLISLTDDWDKSVIENFFTETFNHSVVVESIDFYDTAWSIKNK